MSFGTEAQEFEDNIFSGMLLNLHRFEIRLPIEVKPELAVPLLQLAERLRGKRLVASLNGKPTESGILLRNLISRCIDAFETSMIRSTTRRRERAGVPVPAHFLTDIERETLEAFVMWLIRGHFDEIRTGGREHLLQKVSENFTDP